MTPISQLRHHKQRRNQSQRRTLMMRVGVVGTLCVLGLFMMTTTMRPSSWSMRTNNRNHHDAVSPAHLLRSHRMLELQRQFKSSQQGDSNNRKKNDSRTKEKTINNQAPPPKEDDGGNEELEELEKDEGEDGTDGDIASGTAEEEIKSESVGKTDKEPQAEGSVSPGEDGSEDEEAVDASPSDDVEAEAGDGASGDGELYENAGDSVEDDDKSKKEESAYLDGDDSGPLEPEEVALADIEPRKYVFQFGHLVPDKKGKTKGTVTIVTHPEWAPIGTKHFHELVEDGYYRHCSFFRVLPNFIAQFGINPDPEVTAEAKKVVLKDDPVMHTNSRGTLSYATSGPNTRTTQLFFNLREEGNDFLDRKGFAPFAEVIEGIETLDRIVSDYGEEPNQAKIVNKGRSYLDLNFPKLTYIKHIWMEKMEKTDESS